jgi:hypothetical protein
MKTLLIISLLGIAMAASAAAQSLTAPARTQQIQKKKTTAPVVRGEASGVIPRAIRGGNPLQMLNPRAPARYGTAEESVMTEAYYPRRSTVEDPSYPGKWRGIKFFSIVF